MITARTFVRFTFAALFVNALAVACTVQSSNDDENCDSGPTQSCDCSDGAQGSRKCNASGTGYGMCVCSDGSGSGSGGEGGGGTDNGGGSDSGGGESPGGGGDSLGGSGGQVSGGAAGEGGSGGVANLAGAAGSGGEGGVGNTIPAICVADDPLSCEACYYSCCDEWVACTDDATCPDEFFAILACTDLIKSEDKRNVKVEDLAACADEVGTSGGGWSSGLTPQTIAMVNCLGGDPSSDTWSDQTAWPADSCNDLCFKK